MDPITIFTGATGLNTVTDPIRLPKQENGMSDLQVAVNITINSSFRPNMRKGVVELQSGEFHSLFCDGGDCFVVKNDALYQVAADGTLTGIRSGLTVGALMDFAQFGDRTYYMNGFELGWLQGGISNIWTKGTYTGPDTNRVFSDLIAGNHLAIFYGRILVSSDNVLWWSEPYDFGLFNQTESFVQFHTKILMMKPVSNGCFISTEKNTYFLEGLNPKAWILRHVANFPAVEWSTAIQYVEGMEVGLQSPGLCAIWASSEGAILGTSTGQIINLNKEKVIYRENAKIGFGCLIGYNFIHGME